MAEKNPQSESPVKFEAWQSRNGQFSNAARTKKGFVRCSEWADIFPLIDVSRRRIRVRHFYDRHLRVRVVQVLVGNGYGAR